jgi:MFS family permease
LSLANPHSGVRAGAAVAGLVGAASFAAELLASVPLGMAADALRPRSLMSAGAAVGASAALLYAFAHSAPVFFAGRLLEGIGAAAVVPALLAYLADVTQKRPALRVRVMSVFELTLLAGLALGGIVAAQLFRALQSGAFFAIGTLYALCAAVLFASGGRQIRHVTDPIANLRAVFGIASLRQLAPIWVCVNAIVGLWLGPTLPYLLTQRSTSGQFLAGIDAAAPARVGLVLFAYAVVFGSGIAIWSVVLPRLRLARAMRISLGAMLPACALIFALNHSAQFSAPLRWIEGGILVLLIMLESGFTPAALSWLAQTLPVQSGRAAAMGVYSVLLSVGAIVGSLLAALLGQRSAIDGLLAGTVLMTVIALLLLVRLPDAALPAAGVHA